MRLALLASGLATVALLGQTSDADISHQWALQYLKAPAAWIISAGAGVKIAVIDSGVAPVSDPQTCLLDGTDFTSLARRDSNGQIDLDQDGHGSGIASLIIGSGRARTGALTIGLAPKSCVLPIRAYSESPAELAYNLAPAIDYASANRSAIINLSISDPADNNDVRSSVRNALAHDIVVVAAVGNGGDSRQYYPAAYPGVLGVGAIDRYGKVWSQSNTGADVGLVAPGVDIYRDDNRGRQGYSDGTSEATAYVSAAAALVRSAHPTWTAPQVVAALIATADKPAAMHGAVRTDEYGYGILDVLAALRLSEPPPVGGTASPDPVKSAPDTKAASQSPSGDGSGLAIALVGGVLAGLAALVGTVLVRRRAGARRQG